MTKTHPIRPADDDARALARQLMTGAKTAALAVLTPEARTPFVTRIAMATAPGGALLTLVSSLSAHTTALRADPACALLLGEPGEKGDPLTHPRLTIEAIARPLEKSGALVSLWLAHHPKAKLYADFADFRFFHFAPTAAHLNGGFGKAYRLSPDDLAAP